MNLGLANNLPKQIDETNTSSLNSREQPVLNIIYEHNKNLDSSGNTIFTSQFDSFDMSQITLQVNALSENIILSVKYNFITKTCVYILYFSDYLFI